MEDSLKRLFDEINAKHFAGLLDGESLRLGWNSRLRSSAGRFIPGRRTRWGILERWPAIEIARYLLSEPDCEALVRDTLGHEMIHYWLWDRRRPYGHTPEFWKKMKEMGVSRYNTVPRVRPYKYLYRCPGCAGEFPARRRLGTLACARCCKRHSGGRYDARFRLFLEKQLPPGWERPKSSGPGESPELAD